MRGHSPDGGLSSATLIQCDFVSHDLCARGSHGVAAVVVARLAACVRLVVALVA